MPPPATKASSTSSSTEVTLSSQYLSAAAEYITNALRRLVRVPSSTAVPLFGFILTRAAQLRCEQARRLLYNGEIVEAFWKILLASTARKVSLECLAGVPDSTRVRIAGGQRLATLDDPRKFILELCGDAIMQLLSQLSPEKIVQRQSEIRCNMDSEDQLLISAFYNFGFEIMQPLELNPTFFGIRTEWLSDLGMGSFNLTDPDVCLPLAISLYEKANIVSLGDGGGGGGYVRAHTPTLYTHALLFVDAQCIW